MKNSLIMRFTVKKNVKKDLVSKEVREEKEEAERKIVE